MAANPITFEEIDAYCRRMRLDLTAWETRLIRRLDDAALKAVHERTGKSGKPDSSEIPASNTKGVRSMFRGLMASKKPTAPAVFPPRKPGR